MFYRRIGRVLCLLLAVIALQATASAEANPGIDTWDPLLPPRVASAGAPGDPLAVANASLRAGTLAAQTTMDLGRAFLQSLGASEFRRCRAHWPEPCLWSTSDRIRHPSRW